MQENIVGECLYRQVMAVIVMPHESHVDHDDGIVLEGETLDS